MNLSTLSSHVWMVVIVGLHRILVRSDTYVLCFPSLPYMQFFFLRLDLPPKTILCHIQWRNKTCMDSPMHKLAWPQCFGYFISRNVLEILLQMQSTIQRSSDPEQARKIMSTIDTTQHVIATQHVEVICLHRRDNQGLAPCTHEEADTSMFYIWMMLFSMDTIKYR